MSFLVLTCSKLWLACIDEDHEVKFRETAFEICDDGEKFKMVYYHKKATIHIFLSIVFLLDLFFLQQYGRKIGHL